MRHRQAARTWRWPRVVALVLVTAWLALLAGCIGPKRVTTTPPAVEPPSVPESPPSTIVAGEPVLVAVGLAVGEGETVLAAEGPCYLLGDTDRVRLARLSGPRLTVTRVGDRVHWRDEGGYGGDAANLVLQPVDPVHRLAWGQALVYGEVSVFPDLEGGGLTVVNALDLEVYLRGVVPWEIGRPGPEAMAALAAQAVAARTYTVSHLGARRELGFDVWAGVMDQVYRGSGDEDPDCNTAIARTAGLVLRHEGREIEAFYSAACGGTTSQVEEVWPRPARPYLISHPDRAPAASTPFCASARYFQWEQTWTGEEIERIVGRQAPAYVTHMARRDRADWAGAVFTPARPGADPARPGRIHDLEVKKRTRSGRIARLDLRCDAGIYHLRGDRVRWVLVPPDGKPAILRSAWFDLEVERRDDRVTYLRARGRGYGHGVGLCQSGALAMARAGYSPEEILAHYYPGARLEAAGEGAP